MMGTAWIVSDYPITAAAMERLIEAHCAVRRLSWSECLIAQPRDVTLVILDVTHVAAAVARAFASTLPSNAQVVVTSLDQNEIDLYRVSPEGLESLGALPSLSALSL